MPTETFLVFLFLHSLLVFIIVPSPSVIWENRCLETIIYHLAISVNPYCLKGCHIKSTIHINNEVHFPKKQLCILRWEQKEAFIHISYLGTKSHESDGAVLIGVRDSGRSLRPFQDSTKSNKYFKISQLLIFNTVNIGRYNSYKSMLFGVLNHF